MPTGLPLSCDLFNVGLSSCTLILCVTKNLMLHKNENNKFASEGQECPKLVTWMLWPSPGEADIDCSLKKKNKKKHFSSNPNSYIRC